MIGRSTSTLRVHLHYILFISSMLGATFFTLAAWASLTEPVVARFTPWFPPSWLNDGNSLADLALQKVLQDAAPVFGNYGETNYSQTATWMKAYHDDTPVVHLNLPGAHDADTWNYSLATQQSLEHVTQLVDLGPLPISFFRTQNRSMVDMLNAGIRVFDLRYAYDVTNSTLTFWHSFALFSETATVDDVLFGFYKWLDDHPSEAIFLSFQYESGTSRHSTNDVGVQTLLYNALTSPAARKYFVQTKGEFGTLGEARGKATLLRRFDLDLLPSSYTDDLPGVLFSPSQWTNNSPNITLVYNKTSGGTAYIEDYYQPLTPRGSSAAYNIATKYNATIEHLELAATTHPESLFWGFASSTNLFNIPADTPEIQALGNGTDSTPLGGVNQQLAAYLPSMKGKRLGILMFDFFEVPSDLVPLYLSLLTPDQARSLGS